MTSGIVQPSGQASNTASTGGPEPANLGDILERVLDKGLVIAGDIRVNLLDIELLTIKLRLLVASVDTARQLGIDWWERDPWLTGGRDMEALEEENRELRDRVAELESDGRRPVEARRERDEAAGESVRERSRDRD